MAWSYLEMFNLICEKLHDTRHSTMQLKEIIHYLIDSQNALILNYRKFHVSMKSCGQIDFNFL